MKSIKKHSVTLLFALLSLLFFILWFSSNRDRKELKESKVASEITKQYFHDIVNGTTPIENIILDTVKKHLNDFDFQTYELLYQLKKENALLEQDFYQVYQELNDSIYTLSNKVNVKQNLIYAQKQKDQMIKALSTEIQQKSNFYDSIMGIMEKQLVNVEHELNEVKAKKNTEGFLNFKSVSGVTIFYVGGINAENKAEGYGVAIWETGHRYEGNWFNGLKHGTGVYHYKNGEHYEGNYDKNLRSGQGSYFFTNGDYYVGEWKDDQRNGQGKIITTKGQVKQEGIWEKDKFVSANK
jgi:hypothetical protein